jgi:hypothetical protein
VKNEAFFASPADKKQVAIKRAAFTLPKASGDAEAH